jgi:hypothetical protein
MTVLIEVEVEAPFVVTIGCFEDGGSEENLLYLKIFI